MSVSSGLLLKLPKPDVFQSTDPFFAYDANYLIDNKAGIIVDAEGTRANRIAEIGITETMIERVKDRFDLQPLRLAGDTFFLATQAFWSAVGFDWA
jgi:hypothetical protein